MVEINESKIPPKVGDPRVHMANERTFLAWIRTSIGIMAFGFVVEKFTLFMRRLAYILGKTEFYKSFPEASGYSTFFGIILVVMGALMGVMAFIHYKKTERQIDEDRYRPSIVLDILVAIGIAVIGIFIAFYMVHSV